MTASAVETPSDGGCALPGNTDILIGNNADNASSADATTGIPSTRILSGEIITNTPNGAQEMILSFIDQDHPLDAFSQLFLRTGNGQEGAVVTDAGFNINRADHFQTVLENPFDNHKVIVTDYNLLGVTIDESSGNIQLEHEGTSNKPDLFTAII